MAQPAGRDVRPIDPILTKFGVTIDAQPVSGTVSVVSITYDTTGGQNNDEHLLTTVALENGFNLPVAGALVSISLKNITTSVITMGDGTTGTDGTITLTLRNAPSGTYVTTIIDVVSVGLIWDNVTPVNELATED